MESNNENKLVEKDKDKFREEAFSKIDSSENQNKLKVVSQDKIPSKEEVIDNGFSSFGFNLSLIHI